MDGAAPDLLVSTVREIRSALIAASSEGTEPTIVALLKEVSKDPNFQGEKLTQAQIKKALREAKKQIEVEEEEAATYEPPRQATQKAIDANGGNSPANIFDTCAVECQVDGEGLTHAAPMHAAEFTIEACDATGQRRSEGGDAFFVAIRGASRVRARISDNGNGTYRVQWKPPQSGQYSIAVSFFGVALTGSPWTLQATPPLPFAPNCVVKGSALYNAVARAAQTFHVKYKDKLGNTAHAVDLDVYVEPLPSSLSPRNKTSPLGSRPPDEHDFDRDPSPTGERPPLKGPGGSSKSLVPPPPLRATFIDDGVAGSEQPTMADGSNYVQPEPASGEGSTYVRTRTIRVKIGSAPLIIRQKEDIGSPMLGTVLPGQMVTVLKELISPGKVRAMIALDSVSHSTEAAKIFKASPTSAGGDAPTELAASSVVEEVTTAAPADPIAPAGEISAEAADGGDDASGSALVDAEESVLGNVGWVTLLKDGKKLVTSRVRQSAGSRQQHERQWVRRLANDKAAKTTTQASKTDKVVELELSSDPTGIGFAFGGIYPGTLHARGHLHETHNVSYSIGLVGEYLLHVRLRQQAAALPGSPFNLVVMPGPAHATSTELTKEAIFGTVGMDASSSGCGVLITTADVMGNACVNGGAKVTGDCFGTQIEVRTQIEDRGDGSYYLRWNSQRSGTFQVAIKIEDMHVRGSPTQIKLISTHPELARSELSGGGLSHAIAGQPSQFHIKFFDTFGNSAIPKDTFKLGIALLKAGEKNKEAKMHEEFAMEPVDKENGLYICNYTAKKDGSFDLHVWAEDRSGAHSADADTKAERIPFPNSPFHCVVNAGAASPNRSYVDGCTKESRAVDKHGKAVQQDTNMIIAGDSVVFRPQICDELGNAAVLPEGALDVSIVYPDGTSHDMNSTSSIKFTSQSKNGVTTYDIRHEATHAGQHFVHINLHGEPIQQSPVEFTVHESTAEVKMCQLTPPPEHVLYSNSTYTIVLKTFDRFGNPMSHGGLPVSTRLQLIKSGVHDLTTLMPNNNTVEVDDMQDGTYRVNVTLIKITATVKVIVNMDKNIPAAGGELSPVQLTFVSPEGAEEAAPVEDAHGEEEGEEAAPAPAVDPKSKNVKLREAANELKTLMGIGQEGMRQKSAIATAAEAFEEAGEVARRKKVAARFAEHM